MRKFLVCAALVWLAASHASGQEGGGDESKGGLPSFVRVGDVGGEAARLLKSKENKERAWGAYLVGLHGLKEQGPLLVELLSDPTLGSGGWEESIVRQAALDSLIRLDAEVAAENLLPLYQSSPAEVIILLARSPQQNQQSLLPLFVEEMPTVRWLAVGNLLAETKARGFAARLLRDMKIEASVFVFDRDGPHDVGGNGGGGCGCGGDSRFWPDGFPPVSHYALTGAAARGVVVAAPGRHPIYYVRGASPESCGGFDCHVERDLIRLDYLADLLDTSTDDLKFDARPYREIVCHDARQCRRALATVRDEIERSYSALLGRLLKESLLDPAEASELKPDTTLDLKDFRDKKTFLLPDKLKGVKVSIEESYDEPANTDKLPAAAPEPAELSPRPSPEP
jgi:hypothetical protein